MNKEFGIHFGALAEPISKQLKEQGFKFDAQQIRYFEKQVDAITRLRFADLIPDTVAAKAFNKVYKRIQQETNGKKAVSARELYDRLGFASQHWAKWYSKNIINNSFAIENEDFVKLPLSGRSVDFALSIDFAKKLSMLARTEQGEKVRDYFIEVEKAATSNVAALTEAQIILSTIQTMQVQQKAIQVHDEKLALIESKISQIEKTQSVEIKQDYCTILAFCKRQGKSISFSEAVQKGKIASKLSKEKGFDIRKVSDEKYGYVNSYKESVLKEAFAL